MAATILPQTSSIDTNGICALLQSKISNLVDPDVPVDETYGADLAAVRLFRKKIDEADDCGVDFEFGFFDGVRFGIAALSAVIDDPFGAPQDVLGSVITDVHEYLDGQIKERRREIEIEKAS